MRKYLLTGFSKPYIYLHYVNDTLACNKALSVFHCLNDLHPSLTFTMDEEMDHKRPFLDDLVECCSSAFVPCIYRKPTFTSLNLSWDAFAPKSRKVNLIKGLTLLRFVWITRLKGNLNRLKIYFWIMDVLRK